jgi:hypothetical protein
MKFFKRLFWISIEYLVLSILGFDLGYDLCIMSLFETN